MGDSSRLLLSEVVAVPGCDLGPVGEQVEERADPVSFLGGVPEQAVPVHGVHHAPPGAGPGEVPAASRSATMACTVRSVRPTTGLMSRMRASGLRAISTRTCPWPVSSVQACGCFGQGRSCSLSIQLASGLTRDGSREVFLAFYIDTRPPGADPGSALTGSRLRQEQGRLRPAFGRDSFPGPEMRPVPVPAMRGKRSGARSHRRCADA